MVVQIVVTLRVTKNDNLKDVEHDVRYGLKENWGSAVRKVKIVKPKKQK